MWYHPECVCGSVCLCYTTQRHRWTVGNMYFLLSQARKEEEWKWKIIHLSTLWFRSYVETDGSFLNTWFSHMKHNVVKNEGKHLTQLHQLARSGTHLQNTSNRNYYCFKTVITTAWQQLFHFFFTFFVVSVIRTTHPFCCFYGLLDIFFLAPFHPHGLIFLAGLIQIFRNLQSWERS